MTLVVRILRATRAVEASPQVVVEYGQERKQFCWLPLTRARIAWLRCLGLQLAAAQFGSRGTSCGSLLTISAQRAVLRPESYVLRLRIGEAFTLRLTGCRCAFPVSRLMDRNHDDEA